MNKNVVASFSPIEQVLLAANVSLQRTISAMTNNDVVVKPVMTFQRINQFLDQEVMLHLGSEGMFYSRTEIFLYWLWLAHISIRYPTNDFFLTNPQMDHVLLHAR